MPAESRRKVKLLLSTQEALAVDEVWRSASSENRLLCANAVPNIFDVANTTTTARTKKESDRQLSISAVILKCVPDRDNNCQQKGTTFVSNTKCLLSFLTHGSTDSVAISEEILSRGGNSDG